MFFGLGMFCALGQLLEAEIDGGRAEQVELARRIVDLRLVVADDERVALAAALDRPEQVVEVGAVVPVAEVPVERLVARGWRGAARCVADGRRARR